MRALPFLFLLTLISLTTGCAHPISMAPNLDGQTITSTKKSQKVAAYYISDVDRALEVTTPGGGGDKVTYKPYADLELGLDAVLAKKFSAVYAMSSPDDAEFIKKHNVSYIFVPRLETESSSDSAFTWPPTSFKVHMHCKAVDTKGKTVWERNLKGEGNAEFSEFRSNYSLSAQRASEQLLHVLRRALDESPELQ